MSWRDREHKLAANPGRFFQSPQGQDTRKGLQAAPSRASRTGPAMEGPQRDSRGCSAASTSQGRGTLSSKGLQEHQASSSPMLPPWPRHRRIARAFQDTDSTHAPGLGNSTKVKAAKDRWPELSVKPSSNSKSLLRILNQRSGMGCDPGGTGSADAKFSVKLARLKV